MHEITNVLQNKLSLIQAYVLI